ncbi:hypothetical protein D3C78_1080700 [compost metagenome]
MSVLVDLFEFTGGNHTNDVPSEELFQLIDEVFSALCRTNSTDDLDSLSLFIELDDASRLGVHGCPSLGEREGALSPLLFLGVQWLSIPVDDGQDGLAFHPIDFSKRSDPFDGPVHGQGSPNLKPHGGTDRDSMMIPEYDVIRFGMSSGDNER